MRILILILASSIAALRLASAPLELAAPNPIPILLKSSASPVEAFAAEELARYLRAITGKTFILKKGEDAVPERALLVGRAFAGDFVANLEEARLGDDGVRIRRRGNRVLIAGPGERGTLNAVYVLLEHLGCRWFAPNFSFYAPAAGEKIPRMANPVIGDLDITQCPTFRWRKKYIEEGQTHDVPTLLAMVDWMAKVRLNVLNCPIDYEGRGSTKWDNWREILVPELRKRGILIEIGGHGYQNFLPPSRYFREHPEWFGMIEGKRSEHPRTVFATSNPKAVETFIANVLDYLRRHPEIDIFDCWPPDAARWSEAPDDVALGSPTERQMLLLNQVVREVRKEFPKLRVQFLAYSTYLDPPRKNSPANNVEMEFCPIERGFQKLLHDKNHPENIAYYRQLKAWLDGVVRPDTVTLYTYITKYRWRSLPVLVPHLIAEEAAHFAGLGLGGMSSYSEPAAWAALELDHYFLARYSWDASLDVERELRSFAVGRYGRGAEPALAYLRLVEEIVPNATAIGGIELQFDTQKEHVKRFSQGSALLETARQGATGDPVALLHLDKLERVQRYALNEMKLRLAFLEAGKKWRRDQIAQIGNLLEERASIIEENRTRGLIVVDARIR